MNKTLIIAIVGPSGSGKTTLGKHLCDKLGYNWVCSYTTREMRDGEVDGIDHIFANKSDMPSHDGLMTSTKFGGHYYWTTPDQFIEYKPNVYIVDEKGLVEMESMFINNNIHSYDLLKVYVKRGNISIDAERKERDNDRFILPDCYYDMVLKNDGELEDFLNHSVYEIGETVDMITKIIKA